MTPENTLFLMFGAPDFWTVRLYEKWITYLFSARWDEPNDLLKKIYMKITFSILDIHYLKTVSPENILVFNKKIQKLK